MSKSGFLFYLDGLGAGGISKVYISLAEVLLQRGVPVGFIIAENRVELSFPLGAWFRINKDGHSGRVGKSHKYIGDSLRFLEVAIAEFESVFGSAIVLVAGDRVPLVACNAKHAHILNSVHASKLGVQKCPGLLGRFRQCLRILRRTSGIQHVLNGRPLHCVSGGLSLELTGSFGVRPEKLVVIYNPFDILAIRKQACIPTPESIAQEKPFIVGVGRFIRSKHFERLIDAFSRCKFDGDLILIGQGEDEGFLRKEIARLGLQSRVKIVHFHENHHALVSKAKLLVSTSSAEGFGNVIVESLIVGVPVLSLDCPHGPREIIEPLCPEAVVPMNQMARLPDLIDRFVDSPYVIRDDCLRRFDAEHIADQYIELAEKIHLMHGEEING
ncbi:glycosyltransferase [Crenobacter caeni]|uniref:Glycosyltransferase n=1 Tax=Crenobacter caeni TaxID=2705474 RepID=A0A6B2KTZ9_9NEIS|nr:glycosyltransferase [Crenobacter caeni]NDV13469.1 glycosyltransferase [Crenobacter caeni]